MKAGTFVPCRASDNNNDNVSPKQMTTSSSECELLSPNQVIRERWKVRAKIGGGGFGEIYEAVDVNNPSELTAIKVESSKAGKQVLKMEVAVIRRLQGKRHACKFYGCGRNDQFNYLIMTLHGRNLADLRRDMPKQVFSVSTSIRLGLQILESIQDIHTIGFLHRDIKPSNFSIGRHQNNCRTVYMLDFGLARQFINSKGEIRSPRKTAGFRGTVRYASLAAHKNQEMGRHDDLWSLFYMLVEFMQGYLPWRKIKEKDEVGKMKENITVKKLLEGLPSDLMLFVEHIQNLQYSDVPDYHQLAKCLHKILASYGVKTDDPFDWEMLANQDKVNKLNVSVNNVTSRKSATYAQKGTSGNYEATQVISNHETDADDALSNSKKKSASSQNNNGKPKYKRPEFMRPKLGSFNIDSIGAVQARLAPASESDSGPEERYSNKRTSLSVGRVRTTKNGKRLVVYDDQNGAGTKNCYIDDAAIDATGFRETVVTKQMKQYKKKRTRHKASQNTDHTDTPHALADDDGISAHHKQALTVVSAWHGSFDESLDDGFNIELHDNPSKMPIAYAKSGKSLKAPLNDRSPIRQSRSIDLNVNGKQITIPNRTKLVGNNNELKLPCIVIQDETAGGSSNVEEIILNYHRINDAKANVDSDINHINDGRRKSRSNPLLSQLKSFRTSFQGFIYSPKKHPPPLESDMSNGYAKKSEANEKLRARSVEQIKKREVENAQWKFRRKSECTNFHKRRSSSTVDFGGRVDEANSGNLDKCCSCMQEKLRINNLLS